MDGTAGPSVWDGQFDLWERAPERLDRASEQGRRFLSEPTHDSERRELGRAQSRYREHR